MFSVKLRADEYSVKKTDALWRATKAAQAFYAARLITLRERNEIIRAAVRSDCGTNPRELWLSRERLQFQPHRGQLGR